jgi:amidase
MIAPMPSVAPDPAMSSSLGLSATELSADVRAGRRSPRQLVEAVLGRIDAVDRDLAAFQLVRREAALAEADAVAARPDLSELPLAGVPLAVKDNVPVAGEPMRDGSAGSDPSPQTRDHEVVRRLRAAGAVVVGLTSVPELCVFGATDSVFGVTRNPWSLSRTPGGSSGGSAAAVASAMVPVAHGNDGMGSIRIPAACTGLVGIKPGLGTVPAQLGNGSWFDMSENGPLATTVADCALVLSVLADRPELATVAPAPERLRVAVSVKSPVPGSGVDREWAAAATETGRLLAAQGYTVSYVDPPAPTSVALAALARWFAGTELDARTLADRNQLEPRVARHASLGRLALRLGLVKPKSRDAWRAVASAFFADFDVLVTPTLAQPPLEAIRWGARSWLANVRANTSYAPFAAPWNIAGWPAMAVPAGVHSTGTPLSVQLVAPLGGESLLLSVAGLLETLRPWQRFAPAYAPPASPSRS